MDTPPAAPTLRAFVAITPPPQLTRAIVVWQREWRESIGSDLVRWTKPEQIHLTLVFLGDIQAQRLAELSRVLGSALADRRSFRLTLEGAGCFPSTRRPSVLWVGVGGDLAILDELQRRIEERTRPFTSHAETRRFQPHLTIGRVRDRAPASQRVGAALERLRFGRLGEWGVTEVELFESRLSASGSSHTRLAAASLPPAGDAPDELGAKATS